MPYITREDGERFIIPSYRDTLIVKKENFLKREIMLLCANYGDYITLQKKAVGEYEVAFSPDPGYLLGECVWQHFDRPEDMIYCEAIPNTSEAILVIVKGGTVYLDGSFSIDSIPEELVVFKTQKNNFDIYVYGDVPISQDLDESKFAFDTTSVHSFNVLSTPVFPTLEGVKAFQLQLVEAVLKSQGIGVLPVKKIVTVLSVLLAIYLIYDYISTHKPAPVVVEAAPVNPFQNYNDALATPAPAAEIYALMEKVKTLIQIPGWVATSTDFVGSPQGGTVSTTLKSLGGRMDVLYQWADKNQWTVMISGGTITASTSVTLDSRPLPATINKLQDVYATLIDRLSYILPGSALRFGEVDEKQPSYKSASIDIKVDNASPTVLLTVADALKGLPLAITSVNVIVGVGVMSGTIKMQALGN